MANATCPKCSGNLKKIPADYSVSSNSSGRNAIVLIDILHNRCSICGYQELALESYEVVHTMEQFYQQQTAAVEMEPKSIFGFRFRRD